MTDIVYGHMTGYTYYNAMLVQFKEFQFQKIYKKTFSRFNNLKMKSKHNIKHIELFKILGIIKYIIERNPVLVYIYDALKLFWIPTQF